MSGAPVVGFIAWLTSRWAKAPPPPAAGSPGRSRLPPESEIIDAEVVTEEDALGVAPEVAGYLFEGAAADPRGPQGGPDPFGAAGTLDPEVRAVLARKICRILPNGSFDSRVGLQRLAVRALERLARDQVVQVRAALATAIKDIACAPPSVCRTLARDVEQSVAEPILNYCAALTDQDLIAIIGGQPPDWALEAIARRERVSAQVSTAIVDTGAAGATGFLLENHGAEITDSDLERIADRAADHPDWQASLAHRPALPRSVAVKLGSFVDHSVLEILRSRRDLDPVTAREVVQVARRRLSWLENSQPEESATDKARRLYRARKLTDDAVSDALAWNETDFVRAALALMAGIKVGLVDQILKSRSAKAVTALAWRAGLTMRTAIQLQARLALIPSPHLLNARNGTDYPLTPEEMAFQLEFFGVGGKR